MAAIRKRSDGIWVVTLSGGYDEKGKQKRIYRTIHTDTTKTESTQRKFVEKEAARLETDFGRHILTDSRKIRLRDVFDEYLDCHEMAESTHDWYERLSVRINEAIGHIYVQDLTARDIRLFYKKLKNETTPSRRAKDGKLSGCYRLHYHRALSAVLGYALKSGYIAINPIKAVEAPRSDTEEAVFFEPEDISAIIRMLDNLSEPLWKAFFTLELFTSCRPGELIGLNWSDLKGNVLSIQAGAIRKKGIGTMRTAHPKNKYSVRSIILPPEALKPLMEWKSVQAEYRKKHKDVLPDDIEDAMFTGDMARRIDLSSPTQKWRKLQKKYNLKDAPLYSYRHTGASLLIASGTNVREVAGHLGHSRASTTLDKYSHLFQTAAQHTSNIMAQAIMEARNTGENNSSSRKAE